MNTRSLYAIIGVIVLLIVGLMIYNQNRDNSELASDSQTTNANSEVSTNTNAETNTNTSANTTTSANLNANTSVNTNTEGRFSDESDISQGEVYEVKYNGTSYAPANLSINAGDTVVFKNDSTGSFWPASGPHPMHTDYPEFDAKKSLGAGQTFSFKFMKTGTWSFHDHLRSSARGSITVK
jgi:plastocyanin